MPAAICALCLGVFAAPAVATSQIVHASSSVNESPAAGGDGDGALEPGESFQLTERVTNIPDVPGLCGLPPFGPCGPASGTRTSVEGTLAQNLGQGLKVTSPNQPYPDIPEGSTAANSTPFAGALTSRAACGRPINAAVVISSDQANEDVTAPIQTGAQGPAVSRSATGLPATIPNNSFIGVTSTLHVSDPGFVKDVDVRLSITHPADNELQITLTAPDGTATFLTFSGSASGANFTNTIFDDEAAAAIAPGGAPYTGRFRPAFPQGLSTFDGKQQQGDWKLNVADVSNTNTTSGSLTAFGTDISPAVCSFTAAGASDGGGAGDGGSAPDTTFAGVTLGKGKLKADSGGSVKIPVTCPASEPAGCTATVGLATKEKVSASAARRKKKKAVLKLGSATAKIAGGATAQVKIKISSKGLALLKRRKSLKVRITADAKDAAGNAKQTTADTTLSAAKAKNKK